MTEKALFEIPIYSMPEHIFEEYWQRQKDKLRATLLLHGHTEESAQKGISIAFNPYQFWKYNQIIGYVTVCVSMCDVILNISLTRDTVFRRNSKVKHYIESNNITVQWHDHVEPSHTNEQIKKKIFELLEGLQADLSKKKHCLDLEIFNNVIEYVNVRKAIDDLAWKN